MRSTEDEIRELMHAADTSASNNVITISDDVITISDTDEASADDDAADDVQQSHALEEDVAERIARTLNVTVERARAALTLCDKDEGAAMDVISRQLRKV